MTKPSIVFAHGLWADGSCFSKLIPMLLAEGHDVMASQHGLDSLATDVAAVKACLARVPSPAILVGHSYGGTLITHAGTDARVAGLVYIAALAPDADETSQSLLDKFPTTPVFDHIDVPEGRIWLKQSGVETSRETWPRRSKSWCMRHRGRRWQTSSTKRSRAQRGRPSRAGTSSPPKTRRFIPIYNVLSRSA